MKVSEQSNEVQLRENEGEIGRGGLKAGWRGDRRRERKISL